MQEGCRLNCKDDREKTGKGNKGFPSWCWFGSTSMAVIFSVSNWGYWALFFIGLLKKEEKKIHFLFFSACPPSGEDGSESHAETPGSETSRESHSYQTFTNTALKVLGGLLMVLCISSSWVGTTQVVKLTFQSFSCPFFISWFSSNWNILFFPIYYSGHVVLTREKQTPIQKFR